MFYDFLQLTSKNMKNDKQKLIDWFKPLLPSITVIAMLAHIFLSNYISIYGFLKTLGKTFLVFFVIYLINTIGDRIDGASFWSKYYKGNTKKIINLFQIILGFLLCSFFVYYFSYGENRSAKEFFTFSFSILGLILFVFFVAIPIIMSVFCYNEVEWDLKGTWSEKLKKIYTIITFILSVIFWGAIFYGAVLTFSAF